MADAHGSSASSHASTLRGNSIGLLGVAFQAIATMAPAAAVAFSLAPAVPHAGAALPLSVAVALVICSLVALSIAELAKHLPSAGGYFTYASRALGPPVGWLTGWTLSFSYLVAIPGALLGMGNFVDAFVRDTFQRDLGPHGWILYMGIVAAVAFALTFLGVKVSAVAGIVLGTLEILVFGALSIWLIASAGEGNTLAVFDAASSPQGWYGVVFGMLFVFNAFAGFESAASFGEESRNPRVVIPRALLLATVGIGIFLVVCSYAAVVGWGAQAMPAYASDLSPWLKLGDRASGIFGLVIAFAIVNSGFGGAIALVNVSARLLFAMGRINVLPAALGRTSRFGTPTCIGPLVLLATLIAVTLGLIYGPIAAFGLTAVTSAVPLMLVYVLACVSVPVYYLRERRPDFSVLRHVCLPLVPVGVIAIVIALQFIPAADAPYVGGAAAIANGIWLTAGLAIVWTLRRRAPQTLARAGELFGSG